MGERSLTESEVGVGEIRKGENLTTGFSQEDFVSLTTCVSQEIVDSDLTKQSII